MEIAIIVLVVLILIGVKAYVDQRNYKKRLRTRLLREWGRPSEDEYGIEKLQNISGHMKTISRLMISPGMILIWIRCINR